MSRSVHLFIGADAPLEELAGALGESLATTLVYEPETGGWAITDGDARAVLAAHPYVDDGDLTLSRYRYALSAQVPNDVRLHDSREAVMLRRVAERVQHDLGHPALLVLDLQYRDHATSDSAGSAAEAVGVTDCAAAASSAPGNPFSEAEG
jgi:hypothetical protein